MHKIKKTDIHQSVTSTMTFNVYNGCITLMDQMIKMSSDVIIHN